MTKFKGDDPGFVKQVALLEDEKASEKEREMAEKIVIEAADEFGIWIGHGDLLTVKMVQEARASMAGSATLFGKLGFLGPSATTHEDEKGCSRLPKWYEK